MNFAIGDVVVPLDGFVLHCGSGTYTHAIVASVDPFVLVSQHGDMLWRRTVEPHKFQRLCKADAAIVEVALKRLAADQARGEIQ